MSRWALALLLLVLVAACGRGPDRDVAERSPRPTGRATVTVTYPERTAAATAVPPSGTPAAPPGCRNSFEQRCGHFRFDPGTDDARLTIVASSTPSAPKAGDKVTFTLRASDPDAHEVRLGTYEFTQSGPGKVARGENPECRQAYGPWDPPPKQAGTATQTLSYTYEQAGTYEATFIFTSRSYVPGSDPWPADPPGDDDGECVDPFASVAKADVIVNVGEVT